MRTSRFRDGNVGDGRITGIVIRGDEALVHLQDGQERAVVLNFAGVVGFEAIGAIGTDLSHAGELPDDPMIPRACHAAGEPADGLHCFTMFSAWSDEPILKIIAGSFAINRP